MGPGQAGARGQDPGNRTPQWHDPGNAPLGSGTMRRCNDGEIPITSGQWPFNNHQFCAAKNYWCRWELIFPAFVGTVNLAPIATCWQSFQLLPDARSA